MRAQAWRIVSLLAIPVVCALLRPASGEEIRGICLASARGGYGSEACRQQLARIRELGANWVALNDYAWMPAVNRPEIRYGRQGRSPEGDLERCIRDAHALGLKVLLKPHLWSREFHAGKWHGDIRMSSEADWDAWFANYTEYLLTNAKLARDTEADALCIGVELEAAADQEARWRKLIAEVRAVYGGPICYSAAFLEWPKIHWWDAVDVIGITAYWPVGPHANPTEADIRARWTAIHSELEDFSREWNKSILFSEVGYTAAAGGAAEPWQHAHGEHFEQQALLYRIAIEEARKRPFMKGVFLWKWFTSDRESDQWGGDPYTIQDKPLVLEAVGELWK
ncbi:MAG: hypothetical protein NZ561_07365 [Phycisphaerae bacterium]|nr:hypothetical protein [Phycisphaerae bacterium]MDW8262694.1 hypothetical protein [Phycisphaerales bacterium]